MTECESILWSKLKGKQLKDIQFYRQKIIGNYIVDFYCPKIKLVIELDGGQHFIENAKELDEIRDKYLINLGIKVLRFSNYEIRTNLSGVLAVIFENI